jgi:hypothetical protein
MSLIRYGTDAIKIATVGSLLNGDVFAWYNTLIEQPAKHQVALFSWAIFFGTQFSICGPRHGVCGRSQDSYNSTVTNCRDHVRFEVQANRCGPHME